MKSTLRWLTQILIQNIGLLIATICAICMLLALIPDNNLSLTYAERVFGYIRMAFMFDFPTSTGEPVISILLFHVKNTFVIFLLSILFVLSITVPLGVLAAGKQSPWLKLFIYPMYTLSTIPVLLWATFLILFTFIGLNKLFQYQDLSSATTFEAIIIYAAPVISLSIGDGMLYDVYRTVKGSTEKVYSQPWLKALKSRGRSLTGHVSRGLVEPLVTVITSKITYLISGVIVLESIFAWPGIGQLVWDALKGKDYPLIIASVMVITLIVITGQLTREFLRYYMNPHMRGKAES